MEIRDLDGSDFITRLEDAITAFSPKTHDPKDPNSQWNNIRLAAQSLGMAYYTDTLLAGRIDNALRTKVSDLLQCAADVIPTDVDPLCKQLILESKKTVLRVPTDIMETEQEGDDDEPELFS